MMSRELGAMDHRDDESEALQTLRDKACAKAEDIVRRAADLLTQYQQFDDLRKIKGRAVVLPGRGFLVSAVTAEQVAANRILDELRRPLSVENQAEGGRLDTLEHICEKLDCANVYALETAWDVIKRCTGLEQLASTFSLHASVGQCPLCKGKKCPPKGKQDTKSVVHVDAVVNSGAEWLRIVGIGERRLVHEMTEMGWDWGAADESSDVDSDEDCDIPMANIVRQLVAAARANRHDYRPPRLHIVFTRVAEGSNSEIDKLIRKLRSIPTQGVEVRIDCSNSKFLTDPPPPLGTTFQNLVAEDRNVTPTVNLDCSILVALASDVTHSDIEIQPWHRRDVVFQIREEREVGSSLVKALYPVLCSRRLVCTAKAAERFWTIVDTIATATEAARAEIILPKAGSSEKTSEELVAELQTLSSHLVDAKLRLPIEVVETDALDHLATNSHDAAAADFGVMRLPRSVEVISSSLSDLNRNIYFYGWLYNITTVTANNSLAKSIRLLVEEQRTDDEEAGPRIWVFPFTRALATKGRPSRDSTS